MDTRTAPNATTRGAPADDLSALAWVQDELRRTLEAAHKSMRRCLKEAESLGASDVDTVDPAVLRSARSQIHQGVGALELVNQAARLAGAAMHLHAVQTMKRPVFNTAKRQLGQRGVGQLVRADVLDHALSIPDCL